MITGPAKEDFQVRKASVKGSVSDKGVKLTSGFTRRFLVTTDDPNTDQSVIISAAYAGQFGMPAFFSKYPSGNLGQFAYVIGIDANPRNAQPLLWDVVYEYTTDLPPASEWPSGSISFDVPPTQRPSRYGVGYTTITRVALQDEVDGTPILNTAGEQFNPPLEHEIYLPVITVQRAEADCLIGLATLGAVVNREPFYIRNHSFFKHTALMRFRQSPFFEGGLPYWDTTYEFTIKSDGWEATPLDQGTRQKIDFGDGTFQSAVITDKFGNPKSTPSNLNGKDGTKLPDGTPGVYLDGKDGRDGPFNVYPDMVFSNY